MTEKTEPQGRLVIVVRNGIVNTVYCSKGISVSDVEIIDFDLTVPSDIQRNALLEKNAKKILKQIY